MHNEELRRSHLALEGALRISGIVKDMAAFSRPDPRWTRVGLRDVVVDAMR
jgi:hypothetical protein